MNPPSTTQGEVITGYKLSTFAQGPAYSGRQTWTRDLGETLLCFKLPLHTIATIFIWYYDILAKIFYCENGGRISSGVVDLKPWVYKNYFSKQLALHYSPFLYSIFLWSPFSILAISIHCNTLQARFYNLHLLYSLLLYSVISYKHDSMMSIFYTLHFHTVSYLTSTILWYLIRHKVIFRLICQIRAAYLVSST